METFEEFMAAMKALREESEKSREESEKRFAELWELQEENARGFAELRELQKKNEEENAKGFSRVDKSIEKMSQEVRRLNNIVNGEKSEKEWTEIRAIMAKNAKESEKSKEEREKSKKESEERLARIEKMREESEERLARIEKSIEKMSQEVRRLNNTVNGVSKSNGMMAEEFFYNSLKSTKTFGGVRFDKVKKNLYGNASKEGGNLEGEYDITMINGDSLCIVETKYRVRPDDVSDLVKRRLIKFRELLPKYAGYKIYLGIGGMSFENDKMIEKKAKDFGVGILKLNGDVVEIYDKNLKAY